MNRLIVGLVAVLTVLVGVNHVNAELVYWPGNGHWYEAVAAPDKVIWTDARDEADSRGGYLACIESEAENDFVFSLIDDDMYWTDWIEGVHFHVSLGPYLGGYQPAPSTSEPNGDWTWLSGEPWGYTNWDEKQPDDFILEDCLHFHTTTPIRGKTWNDWSADGSASRPYPRAFVVEYETIPEPGTTALLLCGLASLLCWGRRK